MNRPELDTNRVEYNRINECLLFIIMNNTQRGLINNVIEINKRSRDKSL